MGVISIVLTPGRSVAFQIMVVAGTGSDFGIILRTLTGRVISITFLLTIFSVFVKVHIKVALDNVFIHTVRQKTDTSIGVGRWEKNRESGGNSKD